MAAPLNQNHWRTIGATQSLSRFCAIEFCLRKKASMAQKNNANRCIGAAMAQNAMLPPRARSAQNTLCAIGQRSRLTAPLGQSRTLTTRHNLPRQDSTPARPAASKATGRGWIDLVIGTSVLIFNSDPRPIALGSVPRFAACPVDSLAALDRQQTPSERQAHQRARQGLRRSCSDAIAITAFANTVPTRRRGAGSKPRNQAAFGIRPRDGWSWEGIYARGLPHSKSLLGSNGAHARDLSDRQASGETEALAISQSQFLNSPGQKTPTHAGVPRKSVARSIFDLSLRYSAALFEIWGGPGLEKLGLPFPARPFPQKSWVRR